MMGEILEKWGRRKFSYNRWDDFNLQVQKKFEQVSRDQFKVSKWIDNRNGIFYLHNALEITKHV